jgi:hypothetical protein
MSSARRSARGERQGFVTDVNSTIPGFYSTEERKDRLFFSGTAGFMYRNSDTNWTIVGQYYYNGEGYADEERERLIDSARTNETAIKAALALAGLLPRPTTP